MMNQKEIERIARSFLNERGTTNIELIMCLYEPHQHNRPS